MSVARLNPAMLTSFHRFGVLEMTRLLGKLGKSDGFTIVELLVVFAILAGIAGVVAAVNAA